MYTIHREYSLGTPSFLAQDWFDCNDACSALHRDLVVIGPRVSTDVKCCTGTIQLHQEQGIFYTCMKSDMLTTAFSKPFIPLLAPILFLRRVKRVRKVAAAYLEKVSRRAI